MSYSLQMSIWFAIGLVLEAFVLTGRKFNKAIAFIMALCAGLALLVNLVMSFKGESVFSQEGFAAHVVVFAVVFSVCFGYILRDLILPAINEQVLIIWNLLFLYVYFSRSNGLGVFTYIILTLSLLTLANGFLDLHSRKFWKVFFYAWFLFMVVYFAFTQFTFHNLSFLTATQPVAGLNGLVALLTGMAGFYLIVNFWYLFRLIPLPLSRSTTYTERINEWKSDTRAMASKFKDIKIKPLGTSLIILLLGAALALNFHFRIVSDWLIIDLALVLTPLLIQRYNTTIEN